VQQLTTPNALLPGAPQQQPDDPPPAPTSGDLLRLADQCVKCGYCLPHCPTFRLRHDEGESPRGRIALIQGWLSGQLVADRSHQDAGGLPGARVDAHLGNCLECRACEPACPSLVQFGTIMDGARALREARRPAWQRRLRRARLDLLADPRRLPLLVLAARLFRASGLAALVRVRDRSRRGARWPRLAALGRLAPALARPRSVTGSDPRAEPALFLGCLSRSLEQPVIAATVGVLERLRIPLAVPDGQVCCGAMHRHNGYPAVADARRGTNARRFAGRTLIGFASACVGELAEDPEIAAVELCRFLLDPDWPADARLTPYAGTIAVHEPCSHRNVLRDTQAVYRLLERIPQARVVPLPGNDACCGAAGTYVIDHPVTAAELAVPKVDALRQLSPDVLVTTNTGCALHLRARARDAGLAVEVLHPIELLARQLPEH